MDFHGRGIVDGWENPYLIATLATQHAFFMFVCVFCDVWFRNFLLLRLVVSFDSAEESERIWGICCASSRNGFSTFQRQVKLEKLEFNVLLLAFRKGSRITTWKSWKSKMKIELNEEEANNLNLQSCSIFYCEINFFLNYLWNRYSQYYNINLICCSKWRHFLVASLSLFYLKLLLA